MCVCVCTSEETRHTEKDTGFRIDQEGSDGWGGGSQGYRMVEVVWCGGGKEVVVVEGA